MNRICDFNCSDVVTKKYFQEIPAKKDGIKLILISEALPQKSEDYFDGNSEPQFLKNCSLNLEKELDEFINKRVIMLMGDFAIKTMNYIWKRKFNERIIPAGSTYKIRNGVYESHGIRFFPSYTQTGESFGLEKSKVAMIKEDVEKAMKILE